MTTQNTPAVAANGETKSRNEIFRQLRIENNDAGIVLVIPGATARLINWSRRGIGFEIDGAGSRYGHGTKVDNIKLRYENIEIFSGAIEIRFSKSVAGGTYYGAEFISRLLPAEGFEAAKNISNCFRQIDSALASVDQVKADFRTIIIKLHSSLRIIQTTCEAEERRWRNLPFDKRIEAEQTFLPHISTRVRDLLVEFNTGLSSIIDVETLPEDSPYHQMFHDLIYPYFAGADLARRAYEKPRGYAGDYEMMNQIYRDGYEGDDLFSKILHNYIANERSSNSVKFRKNYFLQYYRGLLKQPGRFEIMSVASGPSVEYQEAIRVFPQEDIDRLHVTLFDLDREALEHAQTRILEQSNREGKRPNVSFVNASVKRFLLPDAATDGQFDLIYSGGLFDYLDNLTSMALTKRLAAKLKTGGTLVIGNFTKENTTKAFCHLLTNWSLLHKTVDEMTGWAADLSGFEHKIEFDDENINAFLVVTRMR